MCGKTWSSQPSDSLSQTKRSIDEANNTRSEDANANRNPAPLKMPRLPNAVPGATTAAASRPCGRCPLASVSAPGGKRTATSVAHMTDLRLAEPPNCPPSIVRRQPKPRKYPRHTWASKTGHVCNHTYMNERHQQMQLKRLVARAKCLGRLLFASNMCCPTTWSKMHMPSLASRSGQQAGWSPPSPLSREANSHALGSTGQASRRHYTRLPPLRHLDAPFVHA